MLVFGSEFQVQVPSSLGEHKEVDQYDHYYQVPDEDHVVLVHLEHVGGWFGVGICPRQRLRQVMPKISLNFPKYERDLFILSGEAVALSS